MSIAELAAQADKEATTKLGPFQTEEWQRIRDERFAELVRAECAQMCLETVNEGNYAYARACRDCAAAIREGKS